MKEKKNRVKGFWQRSFRFYFILFTIITVFVAVGVESVLSAILTKYLPQSWHIPTVILTGVFGLAIGTILSFFIGKLLLAPVKNLQSAMKTVAGGDLSVTVSEESVFEEIANINHSFNQMIRELHASERMQRDFVSNVSHEFKTPLSVLEGYAQLLQDPALSGEQREKYTQKILATTQKMGELIGNILLLSRIDHQALDLPQKRVDLDEQIRTTVADYYVKWEAKNLSFEVDLEEVSLTGNESMLSHVIGNLLSNAVKFSPQNGTVTLTLKREGDRAIFSVADEGPGVPEEQKEEIFQAFYQADSSRRAEGNGLGLALVKRVLEKTGGTVTVENLSPCGAEFTVILPIR